MALASGFTKSSNTLTGRRRRGARSTVGLQRRGRCNSIGQAPTTMRREGLSRLRAVWHSGRSRARPPGPENFQAPFAQADKSHGQVTTKTHRLVKDSS